MKISKLISLSIVIFIAFTGCQLLYPPGLYEDVVQGQGRSRIYVSVGRGDDKNSGYSPNQPIKSLESAIYKVSEKENYVIYVAGGIYTASNGLNPSGWGASIDRNNIQIFGGFDESFSNRNAKTILDGGGTNGLSHALVITNANNIVLDGLTIQNFSIPFGSPDNGGAGIYLSNVNNSQFIDIKVYSNSIYNTASYGGAGILALVCSNLTFKIDAANNMSTNTGGGISLYYSSGCNISGFITNNYAIAGGGIVAAYSQNITIDAFVGYNFSSISGGGIALSGCGSNIINSTVFSNVTAGQGGGIYVQDSTNTIINAEIAGNYSSTSGGGIYATGSSFDTLTISGNIIGNTALIDGGGFAFESGSFNSLSISGNISSNTALIEGGGIYISPLNAGDLSINNVSMVQNSSASGTLSVVYLYTGTPYNNLTISGCTVGGVNSLMTGITFNSTNTITNLTFINNKFITNYIRPNYSIILDTFPFDANNIFASSFSTAGFAFTTANISGNGWGN